MSKLTQKIAIPIILAGIFSISIFIALEYDKLNLNFYVILIIFIKERSGNGTISILEPNQSTEIITSARHASSKV